MSYVSPTPRAQSYLVTESVWNSDVVDNMIEAVIRTVNIPLDGNTYVLPTGIVARVYVSQDIIIQQVTLGLDQVGSIVLDLWVDTYANYPPDVGDTITASAKPTISGATKYQDGTLTGWSKSITGGSWLFINIDSVTTATWCTCVLKVSLE